MLSNNIQQQAEMNTLEFLPAELEQEIYKFSKANEDIEDIIDEIAEELDYECFTDLFGNEQFKITIGEKKLVIPAFGFGSDIKDLLADIFYNVRLYEEAEDFEEYTKMEMLEDNDRDTLRDWYEIAEMSSTFINEVLEEEYGLIIEECEMVKEWFEENY